MYQEEGQTSFLELNLRFAMETHGQILDLEEISALGTVWDLVGTERELDSSQTCCLCSVLQPAVSLLGVFSSRIVTERTPSNQGKYLIPHLFPTLKILHFLVFPLPSFSRPAKFTYCIRLHTHACYRTDFISCSLKKLIYNLLAIPSRMKSQSVSQRFRG